jgi:hypothetical protein
LRKYFKEVPHPFGRSDSSPVSNQQLFWGIK